MTQLEIVIFVSRCIIMKKFDELGKIDKQILLFKFCLDYENRIKDLVKLYEDMKFYKKHKLYALLEESRRIYQE